MHPKIHSCKDMEATQMSMNRCVDKEDMVCIFV